MAKITAKKRRSLPKSKFGLPSKRKFPVDTPGRAANAKARASQQYKRGRITASEKARIFAKANRVLKRSKPKKRSK